VAEANRFILHPTDFSASSEEALRVAYALARDLGVRLVILHVAPFDVFLSDMVVPVDPRVYHDALEEVRRRVDGPDLKYPVETRRSEGDAGAEILRAAGEPGCDLIVMGTHGRTGLARVLMGSVAEYVLSRADCPVLAVKTLQGGSTSSADPPSNASRMSIDWSEAGFAAP
jgi:nucleotide-binding universal stress UspA family protein